MLLSDGIEEPRRLFDLAHGLEALIIARSFGNWAYKKIPSRYT